MVRGVSFARPSTLRMRVTPIAAVMLASALPAMLPMIATFPILPPLGLLLFIAWRRLRSDLWPAWIGLPLGLWDDLFSGQPVGSAMALWTIIVLLFEAVEYRMLFHDQWIDWLLAAVALALAIFGGVWLLSWTGTAIPYAVVLSQFGWSVLAYPLVARLVATLDRWRLRR
jgi:rod shape-determining protein MreD